MTFELLKSAHFPPNCSRCWKLLLGAVAASMSAALACPFIAQSVFPRHAVALLRFCGFLDRLYGAAPTHME